MKNRMVTLAGWVSVVACRGQAELPVPLQEGCADCIARPDDEAVAPSIAPCASTGACEAADAVCPAGGVVYPKGTHSPVTCAIGETWRQLLAANPSRRAGSFIKVGDSISASHEFLHCFSTEDVDLEGQGYGSLVDVHSYFLQPLDSDVSSYNRASLAARASMTAAWALEGDPPPVEAEAQEMSPSYALVMFGTNDLQYAGEDAPADVKYAWMLGHMRALIDWHIERAVLPVLYSIPPYRGQYQQLRQLIPGYNELLRALAGSRMIPFIDYYTSMSMLPNEGLRADGVHPSADYIRLCRFDEEGLQLGYNLRNLLTLEAINRIWHVTRMDEPEVLLDETDAASHGVETIDDLLNKPVHELPLAAVLPLRLLPQASLDGTCEASSPMSVEWRVQLSLSALTPVRVVAVGLGGASVRWRAQEHPTKQCLEETDLIETSWAAGTRELVLEAAGPSTGEVALLVTPCFEDDPRCAP
ncbi:MAG: SGNH/GDSL hydrolase family protein [Myxococcota bacterium]